MSRGCGAAVRSGLSPRDWTGSSVTRSLGQRNGLPDGDCFSSVDPILSLSPKRAIEQEDVIHSAHYGGHVR